MAEEILKELKYGDSKVLVEAAKRDGEGKVIADSYVDKRFMQFPSVEVFSSVNDSDISLFSANLYNFFSGQTGNNTIAKYYYFDASKIKVILDRPITEKGYILVMFQMKKKKRPSYLKNKSIRGYKFTHQTNVVEPLVPIELRNIGFWSHEFRFESATINQSIINTFKSEWVIPPGTTSFNLSGNICVCQTVKQNQRESFNGLALNNTNRSGTEFYGYERLAFAICKYEPTISAKRMLVGPKTIIKTSLIFGKSSHRRGVKFTMR